MNKEFEIIKEELREEIRKEYRDSLADAREKFQLAIDDKINYFDEKEKPDLYKTCIPNIIKTMKTAIQFTIGLSLIFTLTAKGTLEIAQTFNLLDNLYFDDNMFFKAQDLYQHILNIKSFIYIGNALAISSGIELSYMLFTDGPDETIEPLMLAIAAAAFYTISESPENSWAMFGYAVSLLVMIVCLKLYKRWRL
ncbi:TPA: hypothetical protein RQN00_000250 [Aeromonas dhakensis]|nr:hypothetical protein [Aeromonas dhakensis]